MQVLVAKPLVGTRRQDLWAHLDEIAAAINGKKSRREETSRAKV